jgi:hypothetical protein
MRQQPTTRTQTVFIPVSLCEAEFCRSATAQVGMTRNEPASTMSARKSGQQADLPNNAFCVGEESATAVPERAVLAEQSFEQQRRHATTERSTNLRKRIDGVIVMRLRLKERVVAGAKSRACSHDVMTLVLCKEANEATGGDGSKYARTRIEVNPRVDADVDVRVPVSSRPTVNRKFRNVRADQPRQALTNCTTCRSRR